MPVTTRARQTRHLNAENQPDIAKTNLCDQSLKTKAAFDRRARSAKVIVDNHDRLARPSKLNGAINQRVLQARRFLMTFDLLNRRLPNVDDRETVAMLAVDFFWHDAASARHDIPVAHRLSPPQERRAEAGAEPSFPVSR
jgi:hypothetical protein